VKIEPVTSQSIAHKLVATRMIPGLDFRVMIFFDLKYLEP